MLKILVKEETVDVKNIKVNDVIKYIHGGLEKVGLVTYNPNNKRYVYVNHNHRVYTGNHHEIIAVYKEDIL